MVVGAADRLRRTSFTASQIGVVRWIGRRVLQQHRRHERARRYIFEAPVMGVFAMPFTFAVDRER